MWRIGSRAGLKVVRLEVALLAPVLLWAVSASQASAQYAISQGDGVGTSYSTSSVGGGGGRSAPSAKSLSVSTSNAAANSAATGGAVTNNNYTSGGGGNAQNTPNVVTSALAAAGYEVCLGSMTAGGSAAGFGLSVGSTIEDKACQLRLNAKTLATLGYAAAAREVMCQDPNVRTAMLEAGTPCAEDKGLPPAPTSYVDTYPESNSRAAAETPPVSPMPAAQRNAGSGRNCRMEYQLIGGWYQVCSP